MKDCKNNQHQGGTGRNSLEADIAKYEMECKKIKSAFYENAYAIMIQKADALHFTKEDLAQFAEYDSPNSLKRAFLKNNHINVWQLWNICKHLGCLPTDIFPMD